MRWLTLLAVLTACGADPDGVPLGPCHECGSGAIRTGRFVAGDHLSGLAANRAGVMARVANDRVEWLASDFSVADDQEFDATSSTYDPRAGGVMLTDSGAAYVIVDSDDEFSTYQSLIALDPSHGQRWRMELGLIEDSHAFALDANDDLLLVIGNNVDLPQQMEVLLGDVVALNASDGTLRWRRHLPQPAEVNNAQVGIAIGPDQVIVVGRLRNTLDVGGAVGALTAVGSQDAYILSLDPATGDAVWAAQFSVARFVAATVDHLGIGPAGEIAFNVGWETTLDHDAGTAAGELAIGTTTVAPQQELSRAIGIIDARGQLEWIQQSEDLGSLVTDGTRVFGAAEGVFSALSPTGVDWRRPLGEDGGYHGAWLSALAGDRLLGSIWSFDKEGDTHDSISDGDVTISGQGIAYVELVH